MKKAFIAALVVVMFCVTVATSIISVVQAGPITRTLGPDGWIITDSGDISAVKATRYSPVYSAGVCSSQTVTISAANGSMQTLTLASHGTCTINWTQPSEGTQFVEVLVTQGTSSAPMAWTSTLWPGGVVSTASITSGALDWYTCRLTGTQIFCSANKDCK